MQQYYSNEIEAIEVRGEQMLNEIEARIAVVKRLNPNNCIWYYQILDKDQKTTMQSMTKPEIIRLIKLLEAAIQ